MSQILSSLKIVQAKRISMIADATQFRRQKLARKIDEQIELACAELEGREHTLTRPRRKRDSVTGETIKFEVVGAIRQWWFTSDKGTLCLNIRYGAKVMEIAKGRNAIEVGTLDKLIPTLEAVKKAVLSGELDSQIAATAEVVRARFKK